MPVTGPMMRFAYTLLLYALLPLALLHLLLRARREPAHLEHVAERLGFFPAAGGARLIWVHAVSIGETRAAEPLIKALQQRYPAHRILLTHSTPTGRRTGEELFGDSVLRGYLPYDFPFAVRRFLRHFRPEIGVVMEMEIWPNLIEYCRRSSVPVYLVNARMSEKSARRYAWFGGLTRAALGSLAKVAAQTGRDAERLARLGAGPVTVTGNIKFDCSAPPEMLALGTQLRRLFGESRPVFLAASTREGEEALLLDILPEIGVPELLTVIVPRHPQRFEEVAQLLEARGVRYQRRSSGVTAPAGTRVVLGDSMGEMFAYFAACDVAFVGGSLAPLGGQNLIEAFAVGTPVLIGPSTYNFAEATELSVRAGAAIQVSDASALAREARRLLRDPAAAKSMGRAALAFSSEHRGATKRVLELIQL